MRRETSNTLRRFAKSDLDFSTHCPMVFNKQRLQKTIDFFGCHERALLIESLYGNHWFTGEPLEPSFFRYVRRLSDDRLPDAAIVNVGMFEDTSLIPQF